MDPALALETAEIARHRIINETILRGDSRLQRFYAGAVVFVTGGSGFLGKQLIEKLFRSCKISRLYVLLRMKKKQNSQKRIYEMLQDPLYDYLHKNQPHFVQKIIPVLGDITKIQLGIDETTWTTLSEEVNVIFHAAATINFTEPLKVATLTNVYGTREALNFAKSCKNLKSFVHVSTAYTHATYQRIKQPVLEQFYESPLTPDFLLKLVEELDGQKLDAITPEIIKNWPNTYTFTKAVAEELVRNNNTLPVCIVRPAIVMGAHREPIGWTDKSTMNGPMGFILGACLGGLHVMYADPEVAIELVPVDFVNNAVIAAAHETVVRRKRGDNDVQIYTVTGCKTYLRDLHKFLESSKMRNLITPKLLWYGYLIMTKYKPLFFLFSWLLHYIPGYLVDGILVLSGKKPKAIRLFERAFKQNHVYGYFMNNDWKFGNSNLIELHRNLSPADSIIFNCDPTTIIDLHHYLTVSCLGVRRYILKDGLQGTKSAIRKQHWLRVLNAIFIIVYVYIICKVIFLIGSTFYLVLFYSVAILSRFLK